MSRILLETNASRYIGQTIAGIEDEYGNAIDSIFCEPSVVIKLGNGERIWIGLDWRGNDCYISQYTERAKR